MNTHQKQLEKNIPKIYTIQFFVMFMVLMPVIVPYFQSKGLAMADIYALQAIFALFIFILEVPSGYISDLLGRKKTLITAFGFKITGFIIMAASQNFYHLAIAEITLAFAVSLISGTDTSLLYDTLNAIEKNNEKTNAPIKILGKSIFYGSSGEAIAAIFASACMIVISINDVAWVNALFPFIPFLISLTLVEPERTLLQKKNHKDNFKYIYRSMFKHSKLLNLILVNLMFYSVASLFAVWMFQRYWQQIQIPLMYFGYLWAISNFAAALTAKYAHKFEKHVGSAAAIVTIGILPIIGYLGMGLIEAFYGALACLLFQISRGFNQVILKDALNKRVDGDIRATANSIAQMGGRFLFLVFGTLIGHTIDKKGIFITSQIMAAVYCAVFLVVMIPLIFQRKNFISIPST